MHLIDTHAHIYLEDFKEDIAALLNQAKNNSVQKIYMPNIDSSTISSMHALEEKYPEQCISTMGLHPCYVKGNFKSELSIIEKHLSTRKYAGIGEIGIDLYWDKTTIESQEIAFRAQIDMAKALKIPIIIHSRDSLDLTIEIVEECQNGNLKGIFHCFNGTEDQARKIADVGFLMGIGGVVTFKKAGVDKVVSQIPIEHLVLETDSPYLAPTPYRGKRNLPEYIPIIANKIAEIKEISTHEVAKITTMNAQKLFQN